MSVQYLNPRMQQFNTLAGYALGAGSNHISLMDGMSGGVLGTTAILGAQELWKGGKWLWNNKGNYSNAWEQVKNAQNIRVSEQAGLKGANLLETVQNRIGNSALKKLEAQVAEVKPMNYNEFSQLSKKQQIKANNKVLKLGYYKEVRELIAKAKGAKGAELKAYLNQIDEAMAKAKLNIHNAKVSGVIQTTGKTGKALRAVKDYTGITKLSGKSAELAVSSKTFRTIAKGAKGNALFAGVAAIAEAPEIIETYKKCGVEKGTKQLGKTALVIGAEIGGYAAGSAAGAAIGAAIGTAACPVIGTAIGAVCGIAVSCLTGWLARKAVGKSELQKQKEFDALNLGAKAKEDTNVRNELLAAAGEKLKQAPSNDEEAKEALKAYESVLKSVEQEELIKQENLNESQEVLSMLDNLQNFGTYA